MAKTKTTKSFFLGNVELHGYPDHVDSSQLAFRPKSKREPRVAPCWGAFKARYGHETAYGRTPEAAAKNLEKKLAKQMAKLLVVMGCQHKNQVEHEEMRNITLCTDCQKLL